MAIVQVSRSQARRLAIEAAERAAADNALRDNTRADAFVQQFVSMTPAKVEAWIDANVTTIAQARALFKKMALMLLLLARERYRD